MCAHGRKIVFDGDGVEVAGDDDPLVQAQVRASDDGVSVAEDLEVRSRPRTDPFQHVDDGIGQGCFVPGHGFDGAQAAGEFGRVAQCGEQVVTEVSVGREYGISLSRWIDSHVS